LTTAYQICTNIIIMYRGSVVEAGTVEEVIRAPEHPYTQLLIDSIPRMRAVRNWERDEEEEATDAVGDTRQSVGCKFATRCPLVMEKCWTQVPSLYRTSENRVSRCFLYEDQPMFEEADIAKTFARLQPESLHGHESSRRMP
jgi:peptide/nickel transport system ATP-binding protein